MESIDQNKIENPNTPLSKHAMRYALIISGIGIALMLVGHFSGWSMESWSFRLISWAISIGAVVWMIKDFRDVQNGGYLRFGQGVGLSALTGLIAGIITAIFFYIFVTQMSPEFITNVQDKAIEDMAEQGLSDEQIAESMKYAGMFMSAGFMSAMAIIGSVFTYTILGLIVTAIYKRD